jgi:hypothetical protein
MNQRDASIVLDALQKALDAVPSSYHVARLNEAIRLVAPFAQPYRLKVGKVEGNNTCLELLDTFAKSLKEARSLVKLHLPRNGEAWIWSRTGRSPVREIWRRDENSAPYRSL